MNEPRVDTFVPLAEFQRLTGLSDAAIVWLLSHNKIPLAYDTESGVRVDVAHASTRSMVEAMVQAHDELLVAEEPLLMGRITALINTHMESIIETARARIASTPPKST